MKEKSVNISINEYDSIAELNEDDQRLIHAAQQVLTNAYAPYSKFYVGAAVLLDNGEIVTGSNQENAAYPSGLCAERVAIFYANAQFPNASILNLAITAETNGEYLENPVAPCGACRQVIVESQQRYGQPIRVLLAGKAKIQEISNARDLLPLSFDGTWLE